MQQQQQQQQQQHKTAARVHLSTLKLKNTDYLPQTAAPTEAKHKHKQTQKQPKRQRVSAATEARSHSSTPFFIQPQQATTTTTTLTRANIVNILGREIVKLPAWLEREVRIKKHFDTFGITRVDCTVDEGLNGCVVERVEANSACARHPDSPRVGDYLLAVNNEQMRQLSASSAKAILNRASLTSSDIV